MYIEVEEENKNHKNNVQNSGCMLKNDKMVSVAIDAIMVRMVRMAICAKSQLQ